MSHDCRKILLLADIQEHPKDWISSLERCGSGSTSFWKAGSNSHQSEKPKSMEDHNGAMEYLLANMLNLLILMRIRIRIKIKPNPDRDPGPHHSKDSDPRQSENLDENPHESDVDLQHCFPYVVHSLWTADPYLWLTYSDPDSAVCLWPSRWVGN